MCLFVCVTGVFAETVSIDSVVEQANKDLIIGKFEKDSVNNKLVFGEDNIYSYSYNDDYIEFLNSKNKDDVTYEDASKNFVDSYLLIMLYRAFFLSSGYSETIVDNVFSNFDDDNLNFSYNEDGIEIESFKVSVTSSDGSSTVSGDYITKFKFSLDKAYLEKIVSKYNKEQSGNSSILNIPAMTLASTSDSVTIHMVENTMLANNKCDIYRTSDSNLQYTKVASGINCSNGEYIDKNLKSDSTYLYRAVIENSVIGSDLKSIKTIAVADGNHEEVVTGSKGNDDSSLKDDDIKNPETGSFFVYIIFGIMLLSVEIFIGSGYFKNKKSNEI